jgi:hypothetical protein
MAPPTSGVKCVVAGVAYDQLRIATDSTLPDISSRDIIHFFHGVGRRFFKDLNGISTFSLEEFSPI